MIADATPRRHLTAARAAVMAVAATSPTLGTCHRGSLPGGVELPRSTPSMQRLSVVKERGTSWATPRMVAFVLRTANRLSALEAHRDVPLRVGNLSLQGGGDLRWSHSHAAGRDVDFPLFVTDAVGRPASVDGFVHLDNEGRGHHRRRAYRFDAARNWNLIATLLSDPSVDVARIYLAEPLRRLALAHAEASGAPAELLERARAMLSEPSHAGRHDDHIHVRVFCSADEIAGGCVDEDPAWPWTRDTSAALRARIDGAAASLVLARNRRQRDVAVAILAPWKAYDREACRALAWAAAWSSVAATRQAALAALLQDADVGAPCATRELLGAARAQTQSARMEGLLRAAVRLADDDDGERLVELLADRPAGFRARWTTKLRSSVRATIARRLARFPDAAAARALRNALDDGDPTARRAARYALEVLANRRLATADAALGWLRAHRAAAPMRWLLEGFAIAGLPVQAKAGELGPALVELLRGEDKVLAHNAERLLEVLSGGVRLEHLDTPRHRHRAWERYWQLHGAQFADRTVDLGALAEASAAEPAGGSGGGGSAALLEAALQP